jgi:predicted acetyltransferase
MLSHSLDYWENKQHAQRLNLMIMNIIVERANTPELRPVIERLYQLYIHDLSSCVPQAVDEQGQFENPSDFWWAERAKEHLFLHLIRLDGRAIGFAMVGRPPFAEQHTDAEYVMIEFFVARPYRRQGIGREAALKVLECFPGTWELSVAPGNRSAEAFWKDFLATTVPDYQIVKERTFVFTSNG